MNDITREYVREHLPEILPDANKYSRGYLFMVCGSCGMAGAALMAARAALRTGVGYLNLAVPEEIYGITAAAVPEAVFTVYDPADFDGTKERFETAAGRADAVLFGSGTGMLRETLFGIIAEICRKPLLLDADGLNALAFTKKRPVHAEELVLTPHAGEMARLLGTDARAVEADRKETVIAAAKKYGAAVLLKGPETLVYRDEAHFSRNLTGNAGLARAGSGDVLSGIIASLMAQGADGYSAACMGAWLHGRAADRLLMKTGMRSMLPTDVINEIEEVFFELG